LIKSPPPSKSAERIKTYLELIESGVSDRGYAKRYDILKKTMNEAQTDRIIKYLVKNRLIEEFGEGFQLTQLGIDFLEILKKNRVLVGLLTKELSGDRIKPYS
jgi:hypothetical protein